MTTSATSLPTAAVADADNEHVTVSLAGLTSGYAVEDQQITASLSDTDDSAITYAWQVSHDGGNTWSAVGSNSPHYTPSEADEGGLLNVVVTDANNNVGSVTVGVVPLLTVEDNSLSISPNGSVGLGLSVVQETNPDDTISVTISFENRNGGADAPTISAGDHATGQPTTHNGVTTYTFGADDLNSGLTITNHGNQTDTLTVQEILEGSVVATTQSITVVDPPISVESSTIHSGETEELTGPAPPRSRSPTITVCPEPSCSISRHLSPNK